MLISSLFDHLSELYNLPPRASLLMAVSYEIGTTACLDAEIDFISRTSEAFQDLNTRMGGELCNDTLCTDLVIKVLCGESGVIPGQIVAILEVTIPDCIQR